MRAYIVLVDNHVSFEGYLTINKAIDFIKNRSDHPIQDNDSGSLWRYKSNKHIYLIKEINVK